MLSKESKFIFGRCLVRSAVLFLFIPEISFSFPVPRMLPVYTEIVSMLDAPMPTKGDSTGQLTGNAFSFLTDPEEVSQPRFRVAVNFGPSLRVGRLPEVSNSQQKTYLRKLKSGYFFSADLHYFISPSLAVGAGYSVYKSKHQDDNFNIFAPDGSFTTTSISDDITINYIGGSVMGLEKADFGNGSLIWQASLGYMSYKGISRLGSDFLIVTGNTFGLGGGFGYETLISKKVGLGVGLSVFLGTLKKVNVGDGSSSTTIDLPEGSYESLARVDLNLGLRLYQ